MGNYKVGANSDVLIENTNEELKNRINISCGVNCKIHILGLIANNSSLNIQLGDNVHLIIGPNQLMNGVVLIQAYEHSKIIVGEGCLWANSTIWGGDMHSIFDIESGVRINAPEDIHIGNKVWIGYDALILKGSNIKDGCVIGAKSVVTRSVVNSPNSLIVGNPARQVKTGIRWTV